MPRYRRGTVASTMKSEVGCRAGLFIDPVAMPAPRVHKTTTRATIMDHAPSRPIAARHHLRFLCASSTCVHPRNYAANVCTAVIYRSIHAPTRNTPAMRHQTVTLSLSQIRFFFPPCSPQGSRFRNRSLFQGEREGGGLVFLGNDLEFLLGRVMKFFDAFRLNFEIAGNLESNLGRLLFYFYRV